VIHVELGAVYEPVPDDVAAVLPSYLFLPLIVKIAGTHHMLSISSSIEEVLSAFM
jgi:hypothetical protein